MPSLEPIPQPRTDPLIGNLRDIDSEVPIQGFMRMARAMGPIYQLELFGKPTIILSSHELVDEVCDEARFDKRIAGALKNIRDFAGDGLFTAHTREPTWAIARRLLMPAFGQELYALHAHARCHRCAGTVGAGFRGTALTHLAYSGPGTHVSVAVRSSNIHFCPPPKPETPMIMVCAGTGLAPFRGFMQERALLVFGCDHPDVGLLYRDELAAWEAADMVSVRPAFSEAPEGEVRFVQHRLWQDRAEVAELFSAGAHVYVCDDGRFMAPAVRETCARIYREAVGASADDAEAWMDQVERETGRYVADVFA